MSACGTPDHWARACKDGLRRINRRADGCERAAWGGWNPWMFASSTFPIAILIGCVRCFPSNRPCMPRIAFGESKVEAITFSRGPNNHYLQLQAALPFFCCLSRQGGTPFTGKPYQQSGFSQRKSQCRSFSVMRSNIKIVSMLGQCPLGPISSCSWSVFVFKQADSKRKSTFHVGSDCRCWSFVANVYCLWHCHPVAAQLATASSLVLTLPQAIYDRRHYLGPSMVWQV